MKPSEIFGIVVRTVGLILTLIAFSQICFALLNTVGGGPGYASGYFFGIPGLVVGLWLLRGAKSLVSFAFPEQH
jgi:uncharacterized membrane protein